MEVDDSLASSTTPSSSVAGGAAVAHDFDEDDIDNDDEEGLLSHTGTTSKGIASATADAMVAQTPQNDHLNAAAPGELSPPRSQAQDQSHGQDEDDSTAKPPPLANGEPGIDELNLYGGGIGGEDVPGAGWKSKKAQDERSRAMEWIVDRDFSLEPFGDVVLLGKQQRREA